MTEIIDLNTLLPEGVKFEDFFADDEAYENFKEDYRKEVSPKLKEHEEARRRSEEQAREIFLH